MKAFLDEAMVFLNKHWDTERTGIEDLTQQLFHATATALKLFGKEVGRKFKYGRYERSLNRALFEVQAYYFSFPKVRTAATKSKGGSPTGIQRAVFGCGVHRQSNPRPRAWKTIERGSANTRDAAGHAWDKTSFHRDRRSIKMKRTGPSVEMKALARSVKEVETRFLHPHFLPTTLGAPSKQEVLDVAAYVVLVHGALEGFVESLAHWLLKRSVSNWTAKKKATAAPLTIALSKAPRGGHAGALGIRQRAIGP